MTKRIHLTVLAAGLAVGVAALVLTAAGNPGNMGFCIACFLRDISGAVGMHGAAAVQYIRPEIIGLVLGATAMAAVRGRARSERGDVHVTAEGSGAMVDLRLEPAALSRPADELGRVIVETAEAAAREAYERHREVLHEYSSGRPG